MCFYTRYDSICVFIPDMRVGEYLYQIRLCVFQKDVLSTMCYPRCVIHDVLSTMCIDDLYIHDAYGWFVYPRCVSVMCIDGASIYMRYYTYLKLQLRVYIRFVGWIFKRCVIESVYQICLSVYINCQDITDVLLMVYCRWYIVDCILSMVYCWWYIVDELRCSPAPILIAASRASPRARSLRGVRVSRRVVQHRLAYITLNDTLPQQWKLAFAFEFASISRAERDIDAK